MKRALICGISGQDGSYLAKLLLDRGYEVSGSSRDAQMNPFTNPIKLGIKEKIKFYSTSLTDFRSVLQTIKNTEPEEIYNLSGQTSVGLSFEQPVEAFESINVGTLNLLEAIRFYNPRIKLYNASSSECFGNTFEPATELTPFNPRSPYAAAKAAAHYIVSNYREAYNIFACSGILFNHDSPLRPERFVTQKIVSSAVRISNSSKEILSLGNIGVIRDWGWAPEYVDAIYQMMHQSRPEDFVIATGESYSLKDFVKETFNQLGLDWEKYCKIDEELIRPADLAVSKADPSKARQILKWNAHKKMKEVIAEMITSKANS
ncbi:MAG: GDP-mannose 4,6-dehydratase [Ignavibacteriales bacterium UTCHB2]|jgi:GDPmannose 4,6-dehydratase|nr:MAG: GDP-mannose 4,6-dehydratase [Ignavibacteriales bacterium UTCHB2]